MKNKIKITGAIGVIGATLMFMGDMLLYYTPEDLGNFREELVGVLGNVEHNRLMIGGLIGPLAAFLYAIGFYQIYLAIKEEYKTIGKIIFALLSFGIMYGGSFHALFPHLGFMSSLDNQEALGLAEPYSVMLFYMMFFPSLVAYILLTYLIVTKKTSYPIWVVFSSPFVLFWFSGIIELLPQPFLIIIAGGWSNIIFILFFSISTITLLKQNHV
ncbi:MAG: hypothetical protein N4A35_05080 [Flavobacteriales bacterium]|jgi:hypothetical protein|nr:hypothetical protein [Flavobacteriales bacterium]